MIKKNKLILFLLLFLIFPSVTSATATVFTDTFTGTTIDTSKWAETDTGGLGGTTGRVRQNGSLTITGDSINWSTSGVLSQTPFARNTNLTLQADFAASSNASCAANSCLLIPIGIGNVLNISDATADNLYLKVDMFTKNFTIIRGGVNGTAPSSTTQTGYTIVAGDKYRVIMVISPSSGATFKVYDLTSDPTMTTDLLVTGSHNVVTGGAFSNGYIFSSAKSSLVTTTLYGVTMTAALYAPLAPTGLAASPANAQESLSWTAPVDNGGSAITDYLVQYKLTSEPTVWSTFTHTASTATTAVVTGLTNGSSYDFRVSAINAFGTGTASSTATGTPNMSVAIAPTSLSASASLNAHSVLSWTAPSNNGGSAVTDYLIQYKLTSEPTVWTTFTHTASAATTATITGLTNASSYDFRVAAINVIGTGPYSNTATATPNLTNASAPLSLAAQPRQNTQSTLTWSVPSSNGGGTISDYLVEYKLSSEPTVWSTFAHAASTATTITVTGLTNDVSYDFRVSAVNENGTGSPSSTTSATPGNYVFQDNFSGTTINSQWTEYDAGGLGGSVGNVQQNNHATLTGNFTWGANALESYLPFDRRKGDVDISVTMRTTNCAAGAGMQFGYGNADAAGGNTNSTGYFVTKNAGTWLLYYYLNGVNQSGVGTTIPGVSCTDNTNLTMRLVALQAGGAAVYIGSAVTPAVTIATGTFTNKPVWIQNKDGGYTTTVDLITVKGTIAGPEAPIQLTPTVNTNIVTLNWVAPYNSNSPITDYIVEYKLATEPTVWTTYNDGVSTSTSAALTGLTTGQLYDFRVSAVNANGAGDLSSVVTATPLSGTPTAPTASNVLISGAPAIGDVVLGTYVYNDVNGDSEGASTFRWLTSSTVNGTYTAVSGATNINYTITSGNLGKYLKFEVTPVATVSPTVGSAYLSPAIGPLSTVSYLNHILVSGQSLSIGYGGTPVLSSTQPYSNVTLVGSEQLGTTFTPLVESNRESASSAIGNSVTFLSPSQSYQTAVTMHGVGNTAYSGLMKGTVPYANGMTQVQNVFNAAAGIGKTDRVVGVVIIHGEKDLTNGTSAVDYESYLKQWQSDYETDSRAITGQTDTVPLFTDQMMSFTGYNIASSIIPGAQLAAAEDNPGKIVLVGPKYFLTYSDYAHLTNTSYRWLGEYYGKVMKQVLIDKNAWRPLSPDSILRSANVIYAKFHVPAGQLVIDTTNVSARTNYGFEYTDSTSSASISSVELLSNDTVKITLSGTPTGYNQHLRYAYTGTPGAQPGAQSTGSAAGNLRDTDPATSLYGDNLYNWAVNFDKLISPANDVTAPTVTGFSIPVRAASLTIPVNTFTATDNFSVQGYKITETSSAPSAGASGWTATAPSTYTFSSEGSKTLYAWAKDAAGNVSSINSAPVDIDITAPTISSFTLPANSLSLITTISTLTATDNFAVTGYFLSESSTAPLASDAGWVGTAPTTFTFSGSGPRTLYLWTKDLVGNISTSSNATVSISLIATAFTFSGPTTGSVNNATTNFTITPNNPYTGTITLTPTGAGSTGLTPTVLTFSNVSTAQTFTITPQATGSIILTPTNNGGLTNPSVITLTSSASVPNAPTSVVATPGDVTASVSFTAPVSNGGSTILGYTVTSSPAGGVDSNAGSTSTTHAITNLVNGTQYTFTVRATNTIGQGFVSASSNTITPNDTTAPVVTGFSIPSSSLTLTVTLTNFTATDANGVVGYKLTETSTKPTAGAFGWTGTAPATYTFATGGTKTLYAWAKDPSGNVSNYASAPIVISVTNDSYFFSGPSNGVINTASTDFTITPLNPYTGTITITPTGAASTGLTPTVLTFANDSNAQTFTITPTVLGSLTLTSTNSGTLINPPSVSYTVNAAAVVDVTAPVITPITVTPADTSAYIVYNTDDMASTRIDYGATSSYGTSTTETDTTTGTTNHIVSITGLNVCTTYHYSMYSKNTANLSTQSTDHLFTTSGCTGSSYVVAQVANPITNSAGGSIDFTTSGSGIALTVPPSFGSTDANFQIKKLYSSQTSSVTSVPTGYLGVGAYVYDMKALDSALTPITAFSAPLTVSMLYTDGDIAGKIESSLVIYRWDGSTWNPLSSCSVDTVLKKVTCTTTHFSVFGLFGQATVVSVSVPSSNTGGGGGGGGGSSTIYYRCLDKNSTNYGDLSLDINAICKYKTIPSTPAVTPTPVTNTVTAPVPSSTKKNKISPFIRTLKLGMVGEDVRKLQQYLNNNGFKITKTGSGSKGKENNVFGPATKAALIKFQKAKKIKPVTGVLGALTIDAMSK